MDPLKVKLETTICAIDKTTEQFYQNKINAGYEQLQDLLVVISDSINDIFAYKQQGYEIGIDESKLVEVLTEAMKAMEMKDVLLLSDILVYELKELFNEIIKNI